ncbi:uncharacterized protein PV09_07945 [Verruconis gallopava]|uniref:Uncharacterized protein n=1 Tax=Verruconis gallopava TaxID=253628 RepID=A0A0D1YIC5_9PEZI|nr:uncharacterized protein PV09_07945 [Verruconis gallopava]KIW00592.1 hypothetical protein PV09_07945 [Verruconis gallopava]
MEEDWELIIESVELLWRTDVKAQMPINLTENELEISIASFLPRFEPYDLKLPVCLPKCHQNITRTIQIYPLPHRTDGGSTAKLDFLYGGLHIHEAESWNPFFPFGFYVSWGDFLRYSSSQDQYNSLGYNLASPLPIGGDTPFEQ